MSFWTQTNYLTESVNTVYWVPVTDEWLTANQVGAEIGVRGETIKVWARDGELTGWQTPGGHWRFKRADVEAFLATRKATS